MVRTKALTMALAMAGSMTAGAAFAGDVARDRMEKVQDRRELRQDARQTMDDRLDVAKLEATLAEMDRARTARRPMELAAVDRRVMDLLRVEAMETRVEMTQKAGEVRRDNVELRSDAREIPRDANPDARRDLRDDRRDKRDDRRDLTGEGIQASRRRQIAIEYRGLVGRQDAPSADRKRTLLVELIGIARNELRGDHQEMREDKRELREDRRETREDLRDRAAGH